MNKTIDNLFNTIIFNSQYLYLEIYRQDCITEPNMKKKNLF